MPNFDPRSFIITSAFAGVLCTLIFFVLRRSFPKNIGGIAEWGWACLAMVASAFLFSSRDSLSPFFSVVCANTLVVGGILLMHVSVRRFAGLDSGYQKYAGALLPVVAGLVWLTVSSDNYRGRIELITLVNIMLFAASAIVVFRLEKQGFPERFTAAVFAITAMVSFARFLAAITGQGSSDYRNDHSLIQHVYLATFSMALISLSLGFMLMVTKRVQERLEYVASHDDLSGAYTRATFFDLLAKEIERSRRHLQPLSLLILDIDDFKQVNDRYGHPAGDKVIKRFANFTADEMRSHDVLCRYGGEEFAVMLPGTGPDEAAAVAERIRRGFGSAAIDHLPSCTVSIGVGSARNGQAEMGQLIESADQALYIAKKLGKNRVELAPEITDGDRSGKQLEAAPLVSRRSKQQ
jgi:diguanylate cyclase (GGDEF)-like protein